LDFLKVAIFTKSFIHSYKMVRFKQKGFGLATVVCGYLTRGTHSGTMLSEWSRCQDLFCGFDKKRRQQQSIDSGKAAFQGLSVKERKISSF